MSNQYVPRTYQSEADVDEVKMITSTRDYDEYASATEKVRPPISQPKHLDKKEQR